MPFRSALSSRLAAGLSFSSRRNLRCPEAGQGAAPQPIPSGAQSPGRTWVLPSSVRLRPTTPLDKSNAPSGRFQISQVESVAGPKDSESILPLPHHIPPQVRASMSLFLDSLPGLPQQSWYLFCFPPALVWPRSRRALFSPDHEHLTDRARVFFYGEGSPALSAL